MNSTTSQRELRIRNAQIIDAVAPNALFINTRNGEPVAELRPWRGEHVSLYSSETWQPPARIEVCQRLNVRPCAEGIDRVSRGGDQMLAKGGGQQTPPFWTAVLRSRQPL